MFRHVVHCDWSMRAAGRWTASARRVGAEGWMASGPRPVPDPGALLQDLFASAGDGPTLAAFDFPIGFPAFFGQRSGHASFPAALDAMGRGDWPELFAVAERPDELGPRRPFYPARAGGARLKHLLDGHGAGAAADLIRTCERAGPDGGSAGCMFWTMGAKQVGKAALHGWRGVVLPARERGAWIWPFDGDLAALAGRGGLVLAESYPGDGYGQIGFRIRNKRDRALRVRCAPAMSAAAATLRVSFDAGLAAALAEGFPAGMGGDDGFDAVVGLVAALAVAMGARPDGAPPADAVRRWEGWILGKRARPDSP